MAFRKSFRKRAIRKPKRTRKYSKYAISKYKKIPKGIGPPPKMYVKLRFNREILFSLAAGTPIDYLFRLNSLYDPDRTGLGAQPHFFDQLAALYSRYRVYGAKVTFTCNCASSTSNMYYPTVGMVPYGDAAPLWGSDGDTALLARGAMRKELIPGQRTVTFQRYYPCHQVAGVSKFEYDNAEPFQSLTSTNPARGCNLQLWTINRDAGTAITVHWSIQIKYYVKFFDVLLQSTS